MIATQLFPPHWSPAWDLVGDLIIGAGVVAVIGALFGIGACCVVYGLQQLDQAWRRHQAIRAMDEAFQQQVRTVAYRDGWRRQSPPWPEPLRLDPGFRRREVRIPIQWSRRDS